MAEIHQTVKDGDLQRLKELVAQGHSLNDEDDGNFAPVDYAMQDGSNVGVLEFLLAAKAKSAVCFGPPLLWLLSDWSAERLEVFARHADLGAKDDLHGFTALHTAVYEAAPLAVKILLAHGADGSLTDGEGRTPLEYAKIVGDTACAQVFKEFAEMAEGGPYR